MSGPPTMSHVVCFFFSIAQGTLTCSTMDPFCVLWSAHTSLEMNLKHVPSLQVVVWWGMGKWIEEKAWERTPVVLGDCLWSLSASPNSCRCRDAHESDEDV